MVETVNNTIRVFLNSGIAFMEEILLPANLVFSLVLKGHFLLKNILRANLNGYFLKVEKLAHFGVQNLDIPVTAEVHHLVHRTLLAAVIPAAPLLHIPQAVIQEAEVVLAEGVQQAVGN